MKKTFTLSALGLSLLASTNVMAADSFPRDIFPIATNTDRILFEGNNGYRTSKYTVRDLDDVSAQLQKHERALEQLQQENRNKDRQIDELKRSLQELSSRVK
ncbi:hypothetical protein ACQKDS_05830 [Serratia sp. NPDC078593]|uniref:hypothetical protein n=1 Tax=unclassified Serratia (in: enterobacteria) TaxID=2647522 RepID=UPI003D02DF0A